MEGRGETEESLVFLDWDEVSCLLNSSKRLTNEYHQLVRWRATIESNYAEALKKWSSYIRHKLERGGQPLYFSRDGEPSRIFTCGSPNLYQEDPRLQAALVAMCDQADCEAGYHSYRHQQLTQEHGPVETLAALHANYSTTFTGSKKLCRKLVPETGMTRNFRKKYNASFGPLKEDLKVIDNCRKEFIKHREKQKELHDRLTDPDRVMAPIPANNLKAKIISADGKAEVARSQHDQVVGRVKRYNGHHTQAARMYIDELARTEMFRMETVKRQMMILVDKLNPSNVFLKTNHDTVVNIQNKLRRVHPKDAAVSWAREHMLHLPLPRPLTTLEDARNRTSCDSPCVTPRSEDNVTPSLTSVSSPARAGSTPAANTAPSRDQNPATPAANTTPSRDHKPTTPAANTTPSRDHKPTTPAEITPDSPSPVPRGGSFPVARIYYPQQKRSLRPASTALAQPADRAESPEPPPVKVGLIPGRPALRNAGGWNCRSPVCSAPALPVPTPVCRTPSSGPRAPSHPTPSPEARAPSHATPSPVDPAPSHPTPSPVDPAPSHHTPSPVDPAPVRRTPSPVDPAPSHRTPSPGARAPFSREDSDSDTPEEARLRMDEMFTASSETEQNKETSLSLGSRKSDKDSFTSVISEAKPVTSDNNMLPSNREADNDQSPSNQESNQHTHGNESSNMAPEQRSETVEDDQTDESFHANSGNDVTNGDSGEETPYLSSDDDSGWRELVFFDQHPEEDQEISAKPQTDKQCVYTPEEHGNGKFPRSAWACADDVTTTSCDVRYHMARDVTPPTGHPPPGPGGRFRDTVLTSVEDDVTGESPRGVSPPDGVTTHPDEHVIAEV